MKGKKAMHSGKIQKEKTDGMKNMFIFRLIDRLSAVKTHIMAVLCHSGFEDVRHFRKKHAVHVFVFIEGQFTILDENLSKGDTRKEMQGLLQFAGQAAVD